MPAPWQLKSEEQDQSVLCCMSIMLSMYKNNTTKEIYMEILKIVMVYYAEMNCL